METASFDQRLRHHVYSVLAQGAPAPGAASMAPALGASEEEVRAELTGEAWSLTPPSPAPGALS